MMKNKFTEEQIIGFLKRAVASLYLAFIPPQATKILQKPIHRDGLFHFWVCPMAQRLPPLSSAGSVANCATAAHEAIS